jgi:HPt (histidine-containing phosphotransfer) domain-containing protein
MNDYLIKPFKSEDLFGVIAKHLNSKLKKVRLKKKRDVEVIIGSFRNTVCKTEPDSTDGEGFNKIYAKSSNHLNKYVKFKKQPFETINYPLKVEATQYEPINMSCLRDYCDNDEDLQESLIEQFLKDFPVYLNTLKQSILSTNFMDIKSISHKMKSSVALFGLNETRKQLCLIEEYASNQDINNVIATFKKCKPSLEECIKYLSEM